MAKGVFILLMVLYHLGLFNATYPYTISNFVARKAKIPCIQIEINNKYRSKRFKEFDFDHLINCFSELTEAISCFLADNSL